MTTYSPPVIDRTASRLVVRPGQGEVLRNPVGGSIEVKALGEQTDGALSAFETEAAPGEGPPLHAHDDTHEAIYFVEGTFRVRLDDHVHEAPAGTFFFVPKDVPHTWQNSGDTPGRLLALFAPASAGMEQFFQQFAATTTWPGAETFAELAPAAGMQVLGPPLAVSHPL
jgi:quercetin dioxygenase-like cupin family protein